MPRYCAAQLGGGTLAGLLLRRLFGDSANLGTTLPMGSDRQSLLLETV